MSVSDHSPTSRRSVGSTALALGAVWTVGIVLMIGPKDWLGKARTTCIDAAAPGITAVRIADKRWLTPLRDRWEHEQDRFTANADGLASGESPAQSATTSQAADAARLWQSRCEQLQVQLAHAEQVRRQTEDHLSSLDVQSAAYFIEQPAPLIEEELIPANWIGEIGSATGESHPLLSVGAREGIAVDELVLDDVAPHLDRGEQAGVAADSLVLEGRRLVGRVVSVGRWTSTIQPITDPAFRMSVQLLRTNGDQSLIGAQGVLSGHEDGGCRMIYVDATQPVVVGDLVVTPADDPHVPSMLLCGRVTDARLQDGSLEWLIVVEPAVAIDDLTTVAILHQSFRSEFPDH